ncbi:hypothetical protein [Comamonas sp. JC664]|uniref:hypothetical protein n=1 Tax=Comamonas sp. JC664 TaxID=2801917 RepID=UPI0036140ADB
MTTPDKQTDPIADAIARHPQRPQRRAGGRRLPCLGGAAARQLGGLLPGLDRARMGHIDFRSRIRPWAAASASMDRESAIRAYEDCSSPGVEMGVGHWMEQRCVYQSSNYASTRLRARCATATWAWTVCARRHRAAAAAGRRGGGCGGA